MWSFLSPRSLVGLQQLAAIMQLDREILEDWRAGYGPEADLKLERRLVLQRLIEQNR